MLPLATAFFALWACGGEDTSTAAQPQDTTEQKVVEAIRTALGRDVNLDSLKAANPGFIDSIRAVISLSENFEIEPASSAVDGGSEQAPSAQSSSDAALSSAGGTTPADPASSSCELYL